jgi:hypothetical protein
MPVAGSSICSYLNVVLSYSSVHPPTVRDSHYKVTAAPNGDHFSFSISFPVPLEARGPATVYLDQACVSGDSSRVAQRDVTIRATTAMPVTRATTGKSAALPRGHNGVEWTPLAMGVGVGALVVVVLAAVVRRRRMARR